MNHLGPLCQKCKNAYVEKNGVMIPNFEVYRCPFCGQKYVAKRQKRMFLGLFPYYRVVFDPEPFNGSIKQ